MNLVAILTAILNNILPALFKYLFTKKHYLVLLIALFILVGGIFAVSSYFYDNSKFQTNSQFQKMNQALIRRIEKCQNGFMGTVGVVSTEESIDKNNNISHTGGFISAIAVVDGKIVDLKSPGSIYNKDYEVDQITYNLFLTKGDDGEFPSIFALKDKTGYPTLDQFIESTDWGSNKTIERLYLTAIKTDNMPLTKSKVIYVLTFTTNKYFEATPDCNEIGEKLLKFNKEIKSL